jgi:DNA end-binding protein Ku
MEQSGKVGIARFVMRTKQYLAAIRPADGRLMLSTMVYADEVNDPADIPELLATDDVEINDRELAMARQLIESLAADFEPERFSDTYREQVLELIERKASGATEVIASPVEPAAGKVVDLMAALEASVAAAKESRVRHPTSAKPDVVRVSSAEQSGTDVAEAGDGGADAAAAAAEPSSNGKSDGKASARKRAAKRAPAKKSTGKTAKKASARKSA